MPLLIASREKRAFVRFILFIFTPSSYCCHVISCECLTQISPHSCYLLVDGLWVGLLVESADLLVCWVC